MSLTLFWLTGAPPKFVLSDSTNIASGAATATSARLSVPGGRPFQGGKISDDTNPVTTLDPAPGFYTEYEWSIKAVGAQVTNGDVYEFRVVTGDDHQPFDTYTATPQLTIAGTGPTSFSITGSGGLTTSGAATITRARKVAVAGGLTTAGSAVVTRRHAIVGTGGLVTTGKDVNVITRRGHGAKRTLLGTAISPRNWPTYTFADLIDFFDKAKELTSHVGLIVDWADPIPAVDLEMLRALADNRGLDFHLTLSPLSMAGVRDQPSIPAELPQTLNDATTRQAFVDKALEFAATKPSVLGLGTELNFFQANTGQYANLVVMIKAAHDAVKAAYPSQTIMVSFQWDVMLQSSNFTAFTDFGPAIDVYGLTSYPATIYALASDMPSNFYSSVRSLLPTQFVMISEIGWSATNATQEVQQAAFHARFPDLMAPTAPIAVTLALLHDTTTRFEGIRYNDGTPKAAWPVTQSLDFQKYYGLFSGFTLSGSAVITRSQKVAVGGGAVLGGSAAISFRRTYNLIPAGGIALSGIATVTRRRAILPSGGAVTTGTADISATHGAAGFSITGSGGLVTSGVAVVTRARKTIPSGGAVTSGAAIVIRAQKIVTSGGAVIAGAATIVRSVIRSVSGGISLAGAATTSRARNVVGSGGLSTAGNASTTRRRAVNPSGGAVVSGAATFVRSKATAPTGGASTSGTGVIRRTKQLIATGLIVAAGAASISEARNIVGTGGATVSGAATTIRNKKMAPSGGLLVGGQAIIGAGNKFFITGSGDVTTGGTATVVRSKRLLATGSVTLSGFVTSTRTRNVTPVGGMTVTGVGNVVRNRRVLPTGGATTTGTGAPSSHRQFNVVGSGGAVTTGTATVVRKRVQAPSGGAIVAGSATVVRVKRFPASGGAVLSGAAQAGPARQYTVIVTGGTTTGGAAVISRGRTATVSGGLITSGTALVRRTRIVLASGGLTTSGAGLPRRSFALFGAGAVTTTGTAKFTLTRSVVPSGGLIFGGIASQHGFDIETGGPRPSSHIIVGTYETSSSPVVGVFTLSAGVTTGTFAPFAPIVTVTYSTNDMVIT